MWKEQNKFGSHGAAITKLEDTEGVKHPLNHNILKSLMLKIAFSLQCNQVNPLFKVW